MNIFYIDKDPTKCAEQYCNSHVVKMLLETAQILCSVHHYVGIGRRIPYKATHINHPCSIWARESLSHYLWLVQLGQALSLEYTHRYHKTHKSSFVVDWAAKYLPDIENKDFAEPPKCMPDEFICEDTIKSYQKYYTYKLENPKMFHYTNRKAPDFIDKGESHET